METSYSIIGDFTHPEDGERGQLLRSRATGQYTFKTANRYRSVPFKWAQDQAAAVGKASDSIQDQCIARMLAKGWKAIDVAHLLPDMSEAHICGYLSRRASIGSHKLVHILRVLDLEIVESTNSCEN